MIASLANVIADFFVKKQWIQIEEQEIYQYGCEVILSTSVNILIVVFCGLLFNEIVCAVLFYFVFLLLRRYCGGYHADTHLKCNIFFSLMILTFVIILKNSDFLSKNFIFIAIITALFVIYELSPIINKNKPLTEDEAKRYRRISLTIAAFVGMCAVLLFLGDRKLSITVSMALLSVSVAMIIENIKKHGGEKS